MPIEITAVRCIRLASDDFDIPALLRLAAIVLEGSPSFYAIDITLQTDEFGSHLTIYGQQPPALEM